MYTIVWKYTSQDEWIKPADFNKSVSTLLDPNSDGDLFDTLDKGRFIIEKHYTDMDALPRLIPSMGLLNLKTGVVEWYIEVGLGNK